MKSGLSAATAAATAPGGSSATQRVSPQQATSEASAAAADVAVTESRTIYKVKRFLCTLIQFGTEISAETGEKVKELVFNLVVSYGRLYCAKNKIP